jgi:predicted DCC family thiol-disulfide oxidoreductase YuxK
VKDSETKTVVFFDGSCPLCQAEIDFYRRRDKVEALRWVDVSAPGATIAPCLGRDKAMARLHVLARDGQLLSGAAAFAEVWKQLPGWRYAGRLANLPGLGSMLEIGYRSFLLLRPAFIRAFVFILRIKALYRASAP